MDWIFDPQIWITLITLSTLEIVLGVDNLVFISIAVSRLAVDKRTSARRFGLALACITRILLLLSLAWLAQMNAALFSIFGQEFSIRDVVLILGGLFLLVKGTMEIHSAVEGAGEAHSAKASDTFAMVILQIAIIDIVFSLDSVITAIGLATQIPVMVAAILLAVLVMILAADKVGYFIDHHPTIKMLALAFLIVIGIALIADGLSFHIPRGYIYFAMAFSAGVEALNLVAHRRKQKPTTHREISS